jgi:AcrR family transcriptional regulator
MKEKIYCKFFELAKEKGTTNVSLSMLASELNMSKANLYTYFSDKEDLLVNMLLFFGNTIMENVTRIVESEEHTSLEKLDMYISGHIRYVLEDKTFFDVLRDIMLNHMVKDHRNLQKMLGMRDRMIGSLERLTDELKHDGILRCDIPSDRIAVYIGGLLFVFIKDNDRFTIDKVKEYKNEIKNIILKGFGESV